METFENTVGKGKMVETNIFYIFPHFLFIEKYHHLSHVESIVCKCFQFDQAKILLYGRGLT